MNEQVIMLMWKFRILNFLDQQLYDFEKLILYFLSLYSVILLTVTQVEEWRVWHATIDGLHEAHKDIAFFVKRQLLVAWLCKLSDEISLRYSDFWIVFGKIIAYLNNLLNQVADSIHASKM